ncbi:Pvc16 family protein [Kitasatospora griseola]|uniref:Pvc16 family protein n=1 Tax=Kitasatospora griseola TaxID=2064 RepID=UPI0036D8DECC
MSKLPKPITVDMVDYSLAKLMATDALLRNANVSLGAPRTPSAKGESPLINVFLYRFEEDVRRRQVGSFVLNGRESDRPRSAGPPRYAELGYMISAFSNDDESASPFALDKLESTYRPQTSHLMFQRLLTLLTLIDELPLYEVPPRDVPTPAGRSGDGRYRGLSASLRLNEPSQDVRSSGQMWSALSVAPRPFLDVSVTVPLLPDDSGIITGTWVTSLAFGAVPGTDSVVDPSDRTTLGTERLPRPVLDADSVTVTEHNGQRLITFTGTLPTRAGGARAWLSEDDVRLSDLTVTVLSPNGGFRAAGPYPDGDAPRTVHMVAMADHGVGPAGTVLIDSPETTLTTPPTDAEPGTSPAAD